ncbi:protein of unknown function [Rhodovastum atsumiense]|nr:protein of unknown function [Rhodovastum atsumiense]
MKPGVTPRAGRGRVPIVTQVSVLLRESAPRIKARVVGTACAGRGGRGPIRSSRKERGRWQTDCASG